MNRQEFKHAIDTQRDTINAIRQSAFKLHDSVNQHYDTTHPYSLHLQMVADEVLKYGHEVCGAEQDILPIIFGAYYHDSIEDARLTYNDVTRIAQQYMNDQQAFLAAEIVYALTNDKGRTRAERAGKQYYAGIRQTPYAPLVKLADRLANYTYSLSHSNAPNQHMKNVYIEEMPHFIEQISAHSNDSRLALPAEMVAKVATKR